VLNRSRFSLRADQEAIMEKRPLYLQIAESVRQDLLEGRLRPGDALPTVREMAERWKCTPGTVQQAYKELTRQGIAISRPGQGTHIGSGAVAEAADATPLRRATVTHHAEAFLLEMLSAGYTVVEIERSFRDSLDRWRALAGEPGHAPDEVVRFVGSHDPAVSLLTAHFDEFCTAETATCTLQVAYSGSLGGLIALAEGKAELAGVHLWDEETDAYNDPFVRRLLPGRRVALVTLAHRRLGLMVARANPHGITGLADLARGGLRFVNRQQGAGTRVWLDAQLRRAGVDTETITGYDHMVSTHVDVANAIAEGAADVGLGIEAAALTYGLAFLRLTTERYDLVIPASTWELGPVQAMVRWLERAEARAAIAGLGGYETEQTGRVRWVT
jgi:molybdate-binding protein/DNA-binding transcriptional regulator YhcF (GntR family)